MREQEMWQMKPIRFGVSSGLAAAIAIGVARSAHHHGANSAEVALLTALAVGQFLAACYGFWPPVPSGRSRRRVWLLALPLVTTFLAIASCLAVTYLP